jgi:hypothetical protein
MTFSKNSSSSLQSPCLTTAKQAWAILNRHARDDIQRLRLQELCRDNDRVSSLVSVYNCGSGSSSNNNNSNARMIIVDVSRQRMTLETLNHLLRLASARQVPRFIRQLAWGFNDPDNPVLPARLRNSDHTTVHDAFLASKTKRNHHQHHHLQQEPVCRIPSYHMTLH